ncbi:MAG: hypothetical protein ACR2IM_10495 [Sediminibacterium sp.]
MSLIGCKIITENENATLDKMTNPNEHHPINIKKPGSSYIDTLVIRGKAVIFYNPDTAQLKKIEAVNLPMVYKSMVHEYFYQQKTAKIDLKNIWPNIQLYDIYKYRFLKFIFNSNKVQVIDLDNINDISGIIIFNGIKPPEQVDMMSFVNDATYYFDK